MAWLPLSCSRCRCSPFPTAWTPLTYPLLVFGEFTIALLLPLAIGSMLGLGGAARVLGGALLICAAGGWRGGPDPCCAAPRQTPESHLVDIAAHSATPVYYAGDRFNGHDLDRPVMFSQGAESGSDADRTFEPRGSALRDLQSHLW